MTEERVAALEAKVDQIAEIVVGLCKVLGVKKEDAPQTEQLITIEDFGGENKG